MTVFPPTRSQGFYVLFYDNSGVLEKHLFANFFGITFSMFGIFFCSRSLSNLKNFASAKKFQHKSKIIELAEAIVRNIKNYIKNCRSWPKI